MKKYIQIFALILLFSKNVSASMIEQTFKVEIGPFNAAIVKIAYQLTDQQYKFDSKINTSGIFDTFYTFKANYATAGLINEDRLITASYEQEAQSSSHIRKKKLLFDNNGILKGRTSSKDGIEKNVSIEPLKKHADCFDIQTALMMLITQFKNTKSCNMQKTIFNGKKIYHITLEDNGRILFKDKKVAISGEAHKCTAFIHQENVEEGDLLWQVSSERSINFYLMKDKITSLPFLLKVEIGTTPLGKLEAYMTDLKIKE